MNSKDGEGLRIVMMTTSFPAFHGDASGSFILEQARALVALEQVSHVCVITPDRGQSASTGVGAATVALPKEPAIEVIERRYFWPRSMQRLVAIGNGGIPYALRHSLIAWFNIPFLILSFALALLKHARSGDILHMHWGPLGALAILLRPFHRRPVVVTIHGSDLRTTLRPLLLATAFAVRRADAVLVLSQEFYDRCASIRGSTEGIHFAPNGVHSPEAASLEMLRQPIAPGTLRLLTVGRLIPQRNHDLLIDVVARLHDEFPGISLDIVGGGPCYQALKQKIEQLKSQLYINLRGDVATDKVQDYYLQSDLYVSPTSIDNYGTAVVEAALHGLAVVTTSVGFPGELVRDRVDGRVIPPLNKEALYQALRGYLVDQDKLRENAENLLARATAMGLSWPACAERVADIYIGLTAASQPRHQVIEAPTA